MDNDALKNEFLVESFENLSSITEDLTTIEKNPDDKDLLNKIYRTVHTMKGSASFLGYKKLQELTHSSENLLDAIREGDKKINSGIIDTLFQSFDICNAILKSIEDNNSEGDSDISGITKVLDSLLKEDELSLTDADAQEDTTDEVDDAFDDEDDMQDMIASHKESSEAIDNTREEAEASNTDEDTDDSISAAALESMQELINEGKLSQDAISDLGGASTEESNEASEDEGEFNQAALDSLRELAADGSIDPSILAELEAEAKGQAAPAKEVKEAPVETASVPEKPITEKPKVETPKEPVKAAGAKAPKEVANTSPASEGGDDASKKSIADSVVRVNVNILDKIMNTVGELVLNRNQILQFSNNNNNSELSRLALQLNTITSELQSDVMSTRMQPIGSVLTKFERLVRDFARSTDKKIQLKLSGQDTELDKTLIEAIKDPLVHIVRNSCDHGLEVASERVANGKNDLGTLSIKAYNESGQVTIEISDDGKGLNRARILDKAIEKGIIKAENASGLSDQQVFGMIFSPGFSTAEKITNISGRGVGMDVVKTNIEKIGGSVSLSSKEGEGTTFKLKIPLTLAIVPALIVKSLGESFAIPQLNLVELVRLETDEEKAQIVQVQGSEFLKLRGNLTPVFRLNDVLNLNEVNERTKKLAHSVDTSFTNTSQKNSQNKSTLETLESENIAILSAEGHDFGIIVDEILDTEEIVVKPLNNAFKNLSIFGGATIMGDGKVALILDALGFLNQFSSDREKRTEDIQQSVETVHSDDIGEEQENILFRLNDNRIYAVPLTLVTRLEEFSKKNVEMTGKQPIVRYLNSPMPLINVEKTLQLGALSLLEEKEQTQLPCIVTTIRNKNYGIIVQEIMDISIDNVQIDATAVDREGILGTVFIGDRTVSLLDLYKIIDAQKIGIKTASVEMKEKNINATKRILLVDDSAMYRKMESDALLELGYQVTLAKHGEDGFQKLESDDFDLVVTDIEMPILDGYGFAEKVRSSSETKSNIPIVALSTRASAQDKEKGKAAGFTYHLEKFKRDEVVDLIKSIFNGDK